tara:strand:+ start:1482 stop:2240 length:759 start_codon:yes stop_codon:yes gene_type:complete
MTTEDEGSIWDHLPEELQRKVGHMALVGRKSDDRIRYYQQMAEMYGMAFDNDRNGMQMEISSRHGGNQGARFIHERRARDQGYRDRFVDAVMRREQRKGYVYPLEEPLYMRDSELIRQGKLQKLRYAAIAGGAALTAIGAAWWQMTPKDTRSKEAQIATVDQARRAHLIRVIGPEGWYWHADPQPKGTDDYFPWEHTKFRDPINDKTHLPLVPHKQFETDYGVRDTRRESSAAVPGREVEFGAPYYLPSRDP